MYSVQFRMTGAQIDQGQNGGKKELIDGRVWHRARNHDLWRT
jgi:hypothetical protein